MLQKPTGLLGKYSNPITDGISIQLETNKHTEEPQHPHPYPQVTLSPATIPA